MNKFYVYLITNDVNDKVYVGQTTKPVDKRFAEHCSYQYSKIGAAIKEIGKEHFSIHILDDSCRDLDSLTAVEEMYIEKYNSIENGYNARPSCKSNGKIYSPKISQQFEIDETLLQEIKILAIKEKCSVSAILERLILEYLQKDKA